MRILTFVAACTLLLGGAVGAQEKNEQKVADKASASRGNGDAQDPNIRSGSDVNKANATDLPAPPNKGGSTRSGVCEIHIDNRTRMYVKIFVDGDFQGTVGPFGDVIAYAIAGGTRIYGRADFDNGTYTSFGPRVFSCHGSLAWTLNP
jgi:hypothetical protein